MSELLIPSQVQMMLRRLAMIYTLSFLAVVYPLSGQGQPLLDDDWLQITSPHFVLFSQVAATRSERFIRELENWRQAISQLIVEDGFLPQEPIENHVYLFKDLAGFQNFSQANEKAFFYPTPRQNLMAVIDADESSLVEARHHYVHFLMRNFTDLRIPRWYEEGLAGYLANLSVNQSRVELDPYTREAFEGSLISSSEVPLEELLFDESALASPRIIQRANLKSEIFLHFLFHGHEESGFTDRRTQLKRYLALSLEGRSPRFAYDQAFDLTVTQLDSEYERYLTTSSRPQGRFGISVQAESESAMILPAVGLNPVVLANVLGELAINTGKFDLGRNYYQNAKNQQSTLARSYSGLADALRMQDPDATSRTGIESLYQQAIAMGPDDPVTLLDYGVYLESLLVNCAIELKSDQVETARTAIYDYFSKALELAPDNPEANLAMGQYFLLEGLDHSQGVPFQSKALKLLPADTFIMEQTIKYMIASEYFEAAESLIGELAQPMHYWQEFGWVTNLRRQLQHKRQGIVFDQCEHGV